MKANTILLAISAILAGSIARADHHVGTAVVSEHEGCAECGEPKKGWLYKGKKRIHEFRREWRRANRWPEPYRTMAQCSVRRTFDAQTAKGWVEATTLYEHHFDPETRALTKAGKRHLTFIMVRMPAEHRMVHVQTGESQDETQWRLEAVREGALALASVDQLPPIAAVNTLPQGASARILNLENARYIGSVPVPRLPADPGTAGASSGGASAGK